MKMNNSDRKPRILLSIALGLLLGSGLIATIATSRPLGGSHIRTFLESEDAAAARAAIGAGSGSGGNFTNINIVGGTQTLLTNSDLTASRVAVSAADKTLASLAAGTSAQVLHGNASGLPTWSALSLTADVTGTLPVENGGTEATTLTGMLKGNGTSAFTGITGTQYGIGYWSDANTIGTSAAAGNTNKFLRGAPSGAPTWEPVNLGNADVSGTLLATSLPTSGVTPATYGGDAQTTVTVTVDTYGRVTSATESAIDGLDASAIDTGTLGVARGGSGAGTFTAGYLKASGTSAFTTVASVPNTDVTGLGTMSTQAASAVAITGGTIAGTAITVRIYNNDGSATNTLVSADSATLCVNDAATALAVYNLPNATAGQVFSFRVTDDDGIQINAFTGETISVGNATTSAAGYLNSTSIGDRVTLVATTSTKWVDVASYGQWTVSP